MPMSTADGRYWIIYNGEVYNFRELRRDARGAGLPVPFEQRHRGGPGALRGPRARDARRLNGMFAFAIWDARERSLFLARDRLGIKPLYYALDGRHGSLFASEKKALSSAGRAASSIQALGGAALLPLRRGRAHAVTTASVGCCPGTSCSGGTGSSRRGAGGISPDGAPRSASGCPPTRRSGSGETFDSAVACAASATSGGRAPERRARLEQRGGLAGGQAGSGVSSFTVRFAEAGYDEGPLAREVAQRGGLEAHELICPRGDLLPELAGGLAQRRAAGPRQRSSPAGDLPIREAPRHGASLRRGRRRDAGRLCRATGRCAIRRCSPWRPPLSRWLPPWLSWARAAQALPVPGAGPHRGLGPLQRCDVLPRELEPRDGLTGGLSPIAGPVLDEAQALYPGEPIRQAMYCDQHTFLCSVLDRNDRMTMGASIECRVPFLDYRLVEGLAAVPSSRLLGSFRNKRLLREAIGSRLPTSVLRHRKWGFGVPWSAYLRDVPECRAVVSGLPDTELIRNGPFRISRVQDLVARFLAGDREHEALVRQLVMVAVWYDVIAERVSCHSGDSAEPGPGEPVMVGAAAPTSCGMA